MITKLIFIYDGQCPFCNKFAELLELKSNFTHLTIIDARENSDQLPKGYDMDINGALLLKDNDLLDGADAINWICSNLENPSDSLLKLLSSTFSSKKRANIIFPFLIRARRFLLFFKGVNRKI
tara:strand:+ start:492 stop:860 length:369 start_codon:yes stop_codon:yes gene_type:complete